MQKEPGNERKEKGGGEMEEEEAKSDGTTDLETAGNMGSREIFMWYGGPGESVRSVSLDVPGALGQHISQEAHVDHQPWWMQAGSPGGPTPQPAGKEEGRGTALQSPSPSFPA